MPKRKRSNRYSPTTATADFDIVLTDVVEGPSEKGKEKTKRRRTSKRKKSTRKPGIKAKIVKRLRDNKKKLQGKIRAQKKQLTRIERDIRSLTGRKKQIKNV